MKARHLPASVWHIGLVVLVAGLTALPVAATPVDVLVEPATYDFTLIFPLIMR